LSGGEKQRVGVARALASEPRFIICDEAVSALDVSVQAAILNLLADLRDQLNLAILFISHDLSVVAHLADRIAVMYSGAICEIGPTEEILRPPYHPYTQALLSAIPQVGLYGAAPERIRLPGGIVEQFAAGPQCRFHLRCPMKIGEICETMEPPTLDVSGYHRIMCHHRLDELRQLHSILPADSPILSTPPETAGSASFRA
jgi:peptide/nickel transport system ATP-binding protein